MNVELRPLKFIDVRDVKLSIKISAESGLILPRVGIFVPGN